jgi:hypothetical protein
MENILHHHAIPRRRRGTRMMGDNSTDDKCDEALRSCVSDAVELTRTVHHHHDLDATMAKAPAASAASPGGSAVVKIPLDACRETAEGGADVTRDLRRERTWLAKPETAHVCLYVPVAKHFPKPFDAICLPVVREENAQQVS